MNDRGRRPLDGGEQVDLAFRPDTYWPDPDSAYAEGRPDLGYLPPLQQGEASIAYVFTASTVGDYWGIRARPSETGINLTLVNDIDTDQIEGLGSYPQPLTLKELVSVIEEIGRADLDENFDEVIPALSWWERPISFAESILLSNLMYGSMAEDLPGFVRVFSETYAELEEYFQRRIERFLQGWKKHEASKHPSWEEREEEVSSLVEQVVTTAAQQSGPALDDPGLGNETMSAPDAGLRTVEDIFANLQIDEQWSTREGRGFTWWAHRHAQRRWADEPVEDEGVTPSVVHVETEALRGLSALSPTDARGTEAVLGVVAGTASLAATLVDGDKVRFHSTVQVHDEIQGWSSRLIQMAAVVQIANAELGVAQLAETLRLEADESHHPEHGPRSEPDEMIHALEGLPMRDRPWGEQAEYEQLASLLTDRGVLSFPGELGLTVEFPYGPHGGPAETGGTSHLLQVQSTDNEPMGRGLRMTLRLREWPMDDEGQIFPPELSALEAKKGIGAHLLGSWAIERDPSSAPFFTCFLPSVLHAPGSLLNLILSMGVRARWASDLIPRFD